MADTLSREIVKDLIQAGRLDEETVEKASALHFKDYTPENIRDYVTGLLDIYHSATEVIAEEKEKYKSAGKGRKSLEDAYSSGIKVLQHIGSFFHPFSSYGSSMLIRARNLRKEFESICGPYTVRIDADNIKYFKSVLSADTAEDVAVGKLNAIGAMRSGKKGIYGVGALAYYLEKDPAGSEIILRIKWLYVDEDYRERGVAGSLVSEIMVLAKEFGVAAVSTSVSVTSEWSEVVSNWLGSWYVGFTIGLAPENVFDIPGNVNNKAIKFMEGCGSYNTVTQTDFRYMYTRFLRKNGYDGFLLRNDLPADYIDNSSSCYVGDPVSPKGILLSHTLPSGIKRVEYISAAVDNEKDIEQKLMIAFITSLTANSKEHQEFLMEANNPDLYPFFDKALPNPKGDVVLEGLLLPLDATEDITLDDVMDFLQEDEE